MDAETLKKLSEEFTKFKDEYPLFSEMILQYMLDTQIQKEKLTALTHLMSVSPTDKTLH